MVRRAAATIFQLVLALVLCAGLAALAGVLYAHFHGGSAAIAVAWAMWIGGGIVTLLTAASNSPGYRETTRWGGTPFVPILLPEWAQEPVTPFAVFVAGILTIGIGVVIALHYGV